LNTNLNSHCDKSYVQYGAWLLSNSILPENYAPTHKGMTATMADLSSYTRLGLTPELHRKINNALAEGHPLVLAVADENGQPLLSFRGSLQTYSDTQLGFWARNAQGNTLGAIRQNPKVALIYRSETTPLLQFHGRARIATDHEERERVFAAAPEVERKADPGKKGLAIIIDLTRVEGVLGFGPDGPIWCRMAADAP
jgi:Pyridoxamine 5'-phosphate oxidase